ncbi:MAG: hypothetical protein JSS01_12390 [Proteobacteria bacterium]|nr:hypothetical protein [Pseudomonadota bacterium]
MLLSMRNHSGQFRPDGLFAAMGRKDRPCWQRHASERDFAHARDCLVPAATEQLNTLAQGHGQSPGPLPMWLGLALEPAIRQARMLR